MQPGGTSQQLLGVDAVREFNVLRDSYGAEYGKRPGGQVIIVTQSGSNNWHGSVFEFLRNNALDAPNFFDQGSAPPFQRNQFGGCHWRADPQRQDLLLCQLRRLPPAPAPDFGGFRARPGVAGERLCPACSPLLNLWPTPPRRAIPTSAASRQVSAVRCRPFARTSAPRGLTTSSRRETRLSAIYTVDDSDDVTATPARSLQHRHRQSAGTGGRVWKKRTSFHPPCSTLRASVFRGPDTSLPESPRPEPPRPACRDFSSGIRWERWWSAAAPLRIPRPSWAWREATMEAICISRAICLRTKTAFPGLAGATSSSFGVWLQRFQSNETIALSQYGQATFTSLQTFLAGNDFELPVRSRAHGDELAIAVRRLVCRRMRSG